MCFPDYKQVVVAAVIAIPSISITLYISTTAAFAQSSSSNTTTTTTTSTGFIVS
jgi:hypothetical protein